MSPAVWHLLILWMTLASSGPATCSTGSAYVSGFEYVPRLHPSRNPNCPSRYTGDRSTCDQFDEWDRPSIEIRAVLSRCSTQREEITPGGELYHRRKRRHDGERYRGTITNCTRKIVISMRFNNIGRTETEEKFVVIDHALDPSTMKKVPLRDPYVVKVRQEAILQMYGLTFQSVVNAEAREEVINNRTPNFTGCDVDSDAPTCGRTFIHGQPVPFSQGFCCACDTRTNDSSRFDGRNQSLAGSRDRVAKPNYGEAANKPGNRLPAENRHASLTDVPMAERQLRGDATASKKNAVARRGSDERSKRIQANSPGEAVPRKAYESRKESKASRFRGGEKYSGKRVEASPRRVAVADGAPTVDVARDRASGRGNEATLRKTDGSTGSARERDRTERERSRVGEKSPPSTAESAKNGDRAAAARTRDQGNRGLHSVDSIPDVERSRNRRIDDRPGPNLPADAVSVSSTKYSSEGKLAIERLTPKKVGRIGDEKRKGRWPGTGRGSKDARRKSVRKRSEASYPVTPTIDSLATRPPVRLNEPSKNVPTGVSNCDRSASGRPEGRGPEDEANLNRAMEDASPSREITVGTFNEKHGDGYFRSGRNEADKSSADTFDTDDATVLASSTPVKGGSVSRDDDISSRGRRRREGGGMKNYTPQKRTLKDLSFANKRDLREGGRPKRNRVVTGYGSKTYARRSRRQLGNGKDRGPAVRERSGKLEVASRRRGRRRTAGEKDDDGEAVRQVYIDRSRNLRPSAADRSSHDATRARTKEADGQDTVDEKIEDKFSRISDALKEDATGSKGVAEQGNVDANDGTATGSSNEILDANRVTAVVLDEKVDDGNGNVELDAKQGTPLTKKLENEGTGEPVVANRVDNPVLDEPLDSSYKSSTLDAEPIVSPTTGSSSTAQDSNRTTSRASEGAVDDALDTTAQTRALIVVDLFRIPGDSATEPPSTTTVKDSLTFLDKLGGLKKHVEKAFGQSRPAHRTLDITEGTTVMLSESTTETGVATTRITDETFRPSVKATETLPGGGAEFHNEVIIVETTLPEPTNVLTVSAPTARPGEFVRLESISRNTGPSAAKTRQPWTAGQRWRRRRRRRRRKSRRSTPLAIKKRDLEPVGEREAEAALRGGDPRDHGEKNRPTAADSGIKFSFEAANAKLVRRKLGKTSSFSSEQRNYLRLKVRDGDKRRAARKRGRAEADQMPADRGDDGQNGRRGVSGNNPSTLIAIKWIHHPWFVTTEAAEFTDAPNGHPDGVLSGKGARTKTEVDTAKEGSSSFATDGVPGRILPPCTKTASRRGEDSAAKQPSSAVCEAETNSGGRRLLSVSRLKSGKNEHRSGKDRKKVQDDEDAYAMDDDPDTEYEDEPSEHRKRMKSAHDDKGHDKSKKRDTARSKRKKEGKSRDKKSDDYDYFMAQEREGGESDDGTFVDEAKASEDSEREGLPESYDSLPALEETLDKEADEAKISKDPRDDRSYDRPIDDPAATDAFDKYPDDRKASPDREKPENEDVRGVKDAELGKDFEISLTGKIHLTSDSDGRPVSISFNGAPDYFKEGGGSVEDGTPAVYGDRLPSEPANTFVETSDPLAPVGADSANFLPDAYDADPSLSQPLEPVDDRSIAREYYLHTIRARSRNAANYNGDEPASRAQRLLRLRKKSVDAPPADAGRPSSRVGGAFRRSLKRTKKESNFIPGGTEAEEHGGPSDHDPAESSNAGDRSGVAVPSSDAGSKGADGEETIGDSPQISIDLSNPTPMNSIANVDSVTDTDPASCFVAKGTAQKIELPEATASADKFLGAPTKTTPLSIHDLDSGSSSSATTTSTTTAATTTTTNSRNETVIEAKISYPRPSAVAHVAKSIRKQNDSVDGSRESIEKKNMLAVSEFVKKLEKLVSDSGNSTNATGRTLIHLKKFIIVPDNRTFWSLKEFAAPEDLRQSSSTETVVVLGDGTLNKDYKKSLDTEYAENGDDDESVEDDPNLIKEIISSVINGDDDAERDAPEVAKSPEGSRVDANVADPPTESRVGAGTGGGPVEGNSPDLADIESGATPRPDADTRNARKNVDDRRVEASLENEKKASKKDGNVCAEGKSNGKEKRAAGRDGGGSVANRKGKREDRGKKRKKDAKRPKKKRRRKRKRKAKKRKGERNKKEEGKKGKGKWPLKRNLLMLSEEEQTRPLNVDRGAKRGYGDKFSARDAAKRKSADGGRLKRPQIRGRQDCSDYGHPRGVDPSKYLESAHCLRFSDLWYSVYRLREPVIVHNAHLQLYARRTLPDGSTSWKDLTNGSSVRLGTLDRRYRNEENTLALAYSDVKAMSNSACNLDPTRDRLLVPSTLSGKSSKYSEAEGWSNEYLVVQADKINVDANECDKAGVGFAAFVGQPDRCERVSGTCLKNQPLNYWRHDIEARESGQAGCYFLSNFARVPSEAIKYDANGTGSREFLTLEYHSPHVSVIDVELRDDYNAPLGAGSPGRLTEVHVDNTAIDYTVITVLITNKGSSSSSYRARITGCPKGLPASWSNAESPAKTIPPHRDRKVALDLHGRLSLNEFSCSVVLSNSYDEPIAKREIKLHRLDYCFCVRHCACSCTKDATGGKDCRPMSLEDYHAAGFKGPLPATSAESPNWTDALTIVTLVLTILLLFLLFLGFLKWTIGLYAPTVSRWGLDDLLVTDGMTEYYEKDLKSKSVVFNRSGEPVHPETGRKSVRICSRKLAFFLNLIFFYIHPLVICCLFCSKPKRTGPPLGSAESKASLMSDKDESRKIINVSTYGDDINSKMEEEDTRYVIDELKKSQESLQNRSRYKLEQTLREETSSD